jgi:hypothetical protein
MRWWAGHAVSAGIVWIGAFASAAHGADTLVCNISTCAKIGLAANVLGKKPSGPVNEWAKSQIWSYTEDILQVVGLQPNFVLIETGEVSNAAALIQDGTRVLAYNPAWMNQISPSQKWAMYGVLCHEIGHHLQGHTLLPGGSKPPTELEADRYAGFVLAKLGASQDQALSLWQTLSERGSETHPARADRLANVATGWRTANGTRAPQPTAKAPPQNDYVLPHSANKVLVARDIEGLSPALLRIARNEIFARHGFQFNAADLQEFFENRPWYSAQTKDVSLSEIEKANVAFIKAREAANGGEQVAIGFIFPHSSDRAVSIAEVQKLSPDKRRIARNEIFARNGYIFNDPKLDAHFRKMPWYRPTQRDVTLTPTEQGNVSVIRSLE